MYKVLNVKQFFHAVIYVMAIKNNNLKSR